MQILTTTQEEGDNQQEQEREKIKNFLLNAPDPAVLRKMRKDMAKRKYDELLAAISFTNSAETKSLNAKEYNYEMNSFMPFIFFYKFLARKSSFMYSSQMNLPTSPKTLQNPNPI